MNSLLSLRALNILRSLQLAAATRHHEAIENQHSHGCIDAICFDVVDDSPPAGMVERVRAELLLKPGIFFSLFFVLATLAACGSDARPPAENPCACENAPAVPYTIEHCTPQPDGSCADAGVYEGTDLAALFDAICPSAPQQSCKGDVHTVNCEGRTSSFRLVPLDGDAGDAGVVCSVERLGGSSHE